MKDCNLEVRNYISQVKALPSDNARKQKIKSIIRELVKSADLQDWKILDDIINLSTRYGNQWMAPLSILEVIKEKIYTMQNFTMFMYIYWTIFKQRKTITLNLDWKDYYYFARDSMGLILIFNSWVMDYDEQAKDRKIIQQSLLMIANILPNFLNKERIDITSHHQFDSFFIWISYMATQDKQQYLCACNLIKLVKESKVLDLKEPRQHFILSKVMNLLGQKDTNEGNLSLFFDPYTIKQTDIEYFCAIQHQYIEDLYQNHLCNVFINLTKCGVNKEIISLIHYTSHILISKKEYYILRIIYQDFILPILVAKQKTCKKVYQQIYDVGYLYISGFLNHCSIGTDGIEYILQSIDQIENQSIRNKWIDLALACCKNDKQLNERALYILNSLNLKKWIDPSFQKDLQKHNAPWAVSVRNGRRHKTYIFINSLELKGLINNKNDCYIISVVQGLLRTSELPKILSKFRQDLSKLDLTLLRVLRHIFSDLNNKEYKEPISIDSLKKNGPLNFRNKKTQEDAHEYLGQLFQCMQKQVMKLPALFEIFKETFKIDYQRKQICLSCKHQKRMDLQSLYIHSYSTNDLFDFVSSTNLEGVLCEKCQSDQMIMERVIVSRPTILILHINRNVFQKDRMVKKFGNKSIARKIEDYSLSGMICHHGSTPFSGHYTYYSKIQPLRWAQMSDADAKQFQLTKEDQPFETDFVVEKTPYIIFYKRK